MQLAANSKKIMPVTKVILACSDMSIPEFLRTKVYISKNKKQFFDSKLIYAEIFSFVDNCDSGFNWLNLALFYLRLY